MKKYRIMRCYLTPYSEFSGKYYILVKEWHFFLIPLWNFPNGITKYYNSIQEADSDLKIIKHGCECKDKIIKEY